MRWFKQIIKYCLDMINGYRMLTDFINALRGKRGKHEKWIAYIAVVVSCITSIWTLLEKYEPQKSLIEKIKNSLSFHFTWMGTLKWLLVAAISAFVLFHVINYIYFHLPYKKSREYIDGDREPAKLGKKDKKRKRGI